MSSPRKIRILVGSLTPYDAIGNDIVQMRDALRSAGHDVDIFAGYVAPALSGVARLLSAAPRGCWEAPDDMLIYHHSCGWQEGEEVLFGTRNRVVFRTHNVTPPRYFAAYSPMYVRACEEGLESASRAAKRRDFVILGDSVRNCQDLVRMGAAREACRVLPPLHLTEELGRAPFCSVVERYAERVNVLFVGGVKPNKGHMRAIRAFAEYYHGRNRHSRLIFAGGIDERLNVYVRELRQFAAEKGVGEAVVFTGGISASELKSYYVCADVFLCASEHEGFCVPLVEAMHFRVPVVAAAEEGVSETLGDGGLLLGEWNEGAAAAAIHATVENDALAGRLGDLGRDRYLRVFRQDLLRNQVCRIIDEIGAECRRDPRGGAVAS